MKEQMPPGQLADGQAGLEEALFGNLAHIQLPHTTAVHIHCVSGAVCDMLFDIYLAHHPAYAHPYQLLQSQKAVIPCLNSHYSTLFLYTLSKCPTDRQDTLRIMKLGQATL